jgi:Domain of unknown function (DUF4279)
MDEDEKWYSATFVVTSTSLTPEEIQRRLEYGPTRVHHLGEPVSSRLPSGSHTHKHHYYGLHSGLRDCEGMDAHLEALLDRLESKVEAIAELAREASVYFWCGFSSGNGQGGFTLSPRILQRLASLGVEVALDLYPPDSVSSENAV